MALPDITKTPPPWEPNAVPTEHGWRHPETNELLVSLIKGCHPDAYKSEDAEDIPEEDQDDVEEVAEETEESEATEEQPQAKPKKGKKK